MFLSGVIILLKFFMFCNLRERKKLFVNLGLLLNVRMVGW